MLLIDCPYCGPRDEDEFRCGGEAHIERPVPAENIDDASWADYLHNRTNPRGLHRERWYHSAGCAQWFNLVRDTVTHRIVAVYRNGEAPPAESARGNPS
jgi:sarcosine oxidase subunit delta